MCSMFNTSDKDLHRSLETPIADIYSMSNFITFEPYVNPVIEVFSSQLELRCTGEDTICDLVVWLQRFAFDVIEVTFSRRFGTYTSELHFPFLRSILRFE